MDIGGWIKTHEKQAGLGAAAGATVLLALVTRSRSKKTAAAASSGGAVGTGAASQAAAGAQAAQGYLGVPDTSATDIQNSVQDQIEADLAGFRTQTSAQIAAIPRGATGATGAVGSLTHQDLVDLNDLNHGILPGGASLSVLAATQKAAAQAAAAAANVARHQPTAAAVAANNIKHGLNANGTQKTATPAKPAARPAAK